MTGVAPKRIDCYWDLVERLKSMLPADGTRITELTLPWRRSFEIRLTLE